MTTRNPRTLYIGRITLDVLYLLDHLPKADTKVYARELRYAPGGPAVNAAITDAMLGGSPMLMGAVGRGPWADVVRTELEKQSIALLDLAEGTDYETPICTAWISNADATRTIANPPISTVTLKMPAASWSEAVPTTWGNVPRVILADGFHLRETLPLIGFCHANGAAICLDGGSWKPHTEELAPLLTAAVCSERFAVPGLSQNPESIFAWFAERGVPCVAVTRGARPILCSDRGRRFEIAIEQIQAVDTLGAGDVLHGAFCHAHAAGMNFESALRKAAKMATRACLTAGIHCCD